MSQASLCLALSLCRLNRQSKGKKEQRHIVATAEFVGKSISSDFQIFDVFDQSKHDVTIGTIHSLKGTPKKAKYPPNKNCISCSKQKNVWKLVYFGVKMKSLVQKHRIIRDIAYLGV